MAYNKDLYKTPNGFSYAAWDHYAEQLMMYILYAGKDNSDESLAKQIYAGFERHVGAYKSNNLVYCYGNPLFVHQFTHCLFDFRKYVDEFGFDWYENSVKDSRANYNYCVDNPDGFVGFGQNGWGLTACDSPTGYSGYFGAVPNGYDNKQIKNDGTIPPCGALESLVFVPDLVIPTMNYYSKIANLVGNYGFKDAFNLEGDNIWIDSSVIGMDKGIGLLMIENYRSDLIWNLFMENQITKKALNVLEFSQV